MKINIFRFKAEAHDSEDFLFEAGDGWKVKEVLDEFQMDIEHSIMHEATDNICNRWNPDIKDYNRTWKHGILYLYDGTYASYEIIESPSDRIQYLELEAVV